MATSLTKIQGSFIVANSIPQSAISSDVSFGASIPVVANVQVTNSSYTVIDDTAVSTDGGYIRINGSGFGSNTNVLINTTPATSVTVVSGSVLNVQVPSANSGTYNVYVVDNDTGGTAIRINALTYSSFPIWGTNSSLSNQEVSLVNINLSANSDSSVTYSLANGSTLPTGLTLSANGLLSGDASNTVTSQTTYNFTVIATDEENQDESRSFSVTLTIGDQYINQVTTLIQLDDAVYNKDASDNNNDVLEYVIPRTSNFSPYKGSYYSNYFDGSGDYLSVPNDAGFQFGTGDFTVECWINKPAAVNGSVVDVRNGTGAVPWAFYVDGSNFPYFYDGTVYTSTVAIVNNAWNHIAATRSSGVLKIFVNGVQGYSASHTVSLNATGSLLVGGTAAYSTGYISNLRIVKGTALYTGNFTPPTEPLTAISGGTATYTVTNNGASNYVIDGASNPTLTLARGGTYTFNINASGHPFWIQNVSGAYSAGNVYNSGVTNNGAQSGTLTFVVPSDAPDTLYYVCQYHSSMAGTINIISSTSLLTCQSPRFIDNSTNGHTITVNGDTKIREFVPFIENSSYVDYGSLYLSGSNYARCDEALDNISSSDPMTIEAWLYITHTSSITTGGINYWVGANRASSGDNDLILNPTAIYINNSDRGSIASFMRKYCWHHVAFVTDGSTECRIYVDGVERLTYASALTTNPSDLVLGIGTEFDGANGGTPGNYYIGNIADFRVTKAEVYTSTFTPPTSPLTAISNCQLLTFQNNKSTRGYLPVDRSGLGQITTHNGQVRGGSFSPYSPFGHSMYFDGSGDYIKFAGYGDDGAYRNQFSQFLQTLETGTARFTLEAWIYPTAFNTWQSIVGGRANNGSSTQQFILGVNNTGYLYMYSNAFQVTTSAGVVELNNWYHIALVKGTDNYIRIYVNGTLEGTSSTAITQNYNSQNFFSIGANYDGTEPFTGYIANVRFSKPNGFYDPTSANGDGAIMYSSNFTPSSYPVTPNAYSAIYVNNDRGGIEDDGVYRHVAVVNGDVKVTSFTPFKPYSSIPSTYSTYFDDAYMIVADDTSLQFGTGDFTIEMWVYTNKFPTADYNYLVFYDGRGGVQGPYNCITYKGNTIVYYANSADRITSSAISLNTWYHVAVSRSGTSTKMFINGTQAGSTYTDNSDYTNSASGLKIGNSGGVNLGFTGLMSNIRLLKGTALYTSNFTVTTSPLTAISNTSLLLCNSKNLKDNSSYAHSIAYTGEIRPVEILPDDLDSRTQETKVEYDRHIHGGSCFFDGTTDYFTLPAGSDWAFGTGDFTVEGWTNFYSTTSTRILTNRNPSAVGVGTWSLGAGYNLVSFTEVISGEPGVSNLSLPSKLYQWIHYAVVRKSGVLTIFRDGFVVASNSSYTRDFSNTSYVLNIGTSPNNESYMNGFLSDLRIYKKAKYDGPFLPSYRLEYDTDTSLLIPFNETAVVDYSTKGNYLTFNNAMIKSNVSKYGSGSMYFDGSALTGLVNVYAIPFRTSDFTVEFFIRPSSFTNDTYPGLFDCRSSGSDTGGWGIYFQSTDLVLRIGGSNYTHAIASSPAITLNNWHHVAVVRETSSIKVYVDGNLKITATSITNDFVNTTHWIGRVFDDYNYFGYMDGIRITHGVARYTAYFTPPVRIFGSI